MTKTKFSTVFNRKNQLNKQGKGLIQIECYLNGRKKYFSTNIYLEPNYWNFKTKTIKQDFTNAIKLNKQITETLRNLENFELDLINNGKVFSLSMLDNFFKPCQKMNFTEFMKAEIENSNQNKGTIINKTATLNALKRFENEVDFNDLTFEFMHDFEKFCQNKTIVTKSKQVKKLSQNTIFKYFTDIKTFVNLAINKDLMLLENYPFRKFKPKRTKTERTFLTPVEIDLFENVELTGENQKHQFFKDLFLFSIQTGLRYSDVLDLQKSDFATTNGNKTLTKKTQKTGETVRIPINQKATSILNKYFDFKDNFCFNVPSNCTINTHLKAICKVAGINKKVTFHTARHTTATFLIYKGVSITTVSKILGHTNLATTQIYSHIMDETINKELQAVNW